MINPVQFLHLDFSTINIDYVDKYPYLFYLGLSGCNIGGIFPDLSNISATIKRISIQNSGITYIDPQLLAQLEVLTDIYLDKNPLTIIPDVQFNSGVIFNLNINSVAIKTFPILEETGEQIQAIYMNNNNFAIMRLWHVNPGPMLLL